jgi:hypothetical protein
VAGCDSCETVLDAAVESLCPFVDDVGVYTVDSTLARRQVCKQPISRCCGYDPSFGGCHRSPVGSLLDDGVVVFVADSGDYGRRGISNTARERFGIETPEIGIGPAAARENNHLYVWVVCQPGHARHQ